MCRNNLAPTHEELTRLRAVASGRQEADLIIRGGKVVHVHTGPGRCRNENGRK
jgi:adenine deaminase